jgi:hypothetical protein
MYALKRFFNRFFTVNHPISPAESALFIYEDFNIPKIPYVYNLIHIVYNKDLEAYNLVTNLGIFQINTRYNDKLANIVKNVNDKKPDMEFFPKKIFTDPDYNFLFILYLESLCDTYYKKIDIYNKR